MISTSVETKYVAVSEEEQVVWFDDLDELIDYIDREEIVYVFEVSKARKFKMTTALVELKTVRNELKKEGKKT